MNKFEVSRHNFSDDNNPVSVYVSCTTYKVNPLEVEKDIDSFVDYIVEKYKTKSTKLSFVDWVKSKIL